MATFPGKQLTVIGLLVLLLGLGIWGLTRPGKSKPTTPQAIQPAGEGGQTTPTGEAGSGPANPAKGSPTRPSVDAEYVLLEEHFAALSAAPTAEEARRLLAELRSWLKSLSPEVAAAIITRFVGGGSDAELPLQFAIGDGGFLDSPPTFRVALLDFLGWIQPQEAVALGKQILSSPTSADEWAISLRNVARLEIGTESKEYLRAKAEELIRNEEWQEKPSVGYLNAFDVFVHTRATESTPLLSELIQRKDRRDLAHAGFLTLDRLTQREPVAVLERLSQDRELQESRPEMVAQQFARADLRQGAQQEIVRSWLLDPTRTQIELHAFAGIFPNNNQMISRNLLTSEPQLAGGDLRAHDRAVLALVTHWQQDPAFEPVATHLATMARRLRQFTSPAPAPAPAPAVPSP